MHLHQHLEVLTSRRPLEPPPPMGAHGADAVQAAAGAAAVGAAAVGTAAGAPSLCQGWLVPGGACAGAGRRGAVAAVFAYFA